MSNTETRAKPDVDELLRRHRRELHVHCYRMLGSFDEAEDVVQETLLRAWSRRGSVEVGPGFRAWLYRIATNACLDTLRIRKRTVIALGSLADIQSLQSYSDRVLGESGTNSDSPETVAVARETIELAFLAAVQLLPAGQRAVLLLRDLLGWSAAESATALETSISAANSALQRARVTLRERLPADRASWSASTPNTIERAALERFIDAYARADIPAMTALVQHDLRVTMRPRRMSFGVIEAPPQERIEMQYLVSVIGDGTDSTTQDETADIDAFSDRCEFDGHWVFAARCSAPATAADINNQDGQAMSTDGPFPESKE